MRFEYVKNVKVGDKLKVVDINLCSNLKYETNRGNIEKDDTIILTVVENDKRGDKPFLCSINVNGKDKGVKWWISYEAVELVDEWKPKLKSGDKVIRTGKSVKNLMMEEGSIYTVKDVFYQYDEYIITLEECRNEFDYHYTFVANDFKLLSTGEATAVCHVDETYPASEILGENIHVDAEKNSEKYSPLTFQQSGDHYSKRGIQPVEYGIANNLSFPQVNIIKYITRHEDKNGLDDLTKSIHYHFFEALRVYGEDGSDQLRKNVVEMLGLNYT